MEVKSPRVEKQAPKRTVKGEDDEKPKSGSTPKGKGKAKRDEDIEDEGGPKKKRKTVPKKKKVVSDDGDDDASTPARPKRPQVKKEKPFKSLVLIFSAF